jgi:hypothetical protein
VLGPPWTPPDSPPKASRGTPPTSQFHSSPCNQSKAMNAQEALETFRRKAAAGKVANLRKGGCGPISASDQAAIESSFRAAITHAAGKTILSDISFDLYAQDLAQYALQHAAEYGLSDKANRAARCRRFVATVEGGIRRRRRPSAAAVPEAWLPLYGAAQQCSRGTRARAAFHSEIAKLARLAMLHGVDSPEMLPPAPVIREWAAKSGNARANEITRLLWAYRRARLYLLQSVPDAGLPDIDRHPLTDERGIRSLADIVERLEAVGYNGAIAAIAAEDVIRLLAPGWHQAMTDYIDGKGQSAGREFRKRTVGASSRFLAALVRSGHGELTTAHPATLLLKQVETGEIVDLEADGALGWQAEIASLEGISLEDGSPGASERVMVKRPLIEVLAASMASDSIDNSSLRVTRPTDREGPEHWTETVMADVRRVADIGHHAASTSRIVRARPALLHEATAAVKAFIDGMKEYNRAVSFSDRKAKSKLLALITLPQVVCLGIPALRSHVLALRAAWQTALLRYGDAAHPRVRACESKYDRWLWRYLVFAVFIADGLRLTNYSGARLGAVGRERLTERRAPDGTMIKSYTHVEPQINAEGRLAGVATNFYGDDHPSVKLKIAKVAGSDEWREREHWLRPGIVDMELFHDYLTRVRAKHLVSAGLVSDLSDYSLADDVAEWHFALFVSPAVSKDPYRAITGGYTPHVISETYGRMLHWIAVEVLGREVPPYGQELKAMYRRVFSGHSSRLKLGTHLYGVLGRRTDAATLLNDSPEVVEKRYSVVEASMVHRRGWEHPRFFDAYFTRIWDQNEVIDWDQEDPLGSLPLAERPVPLRRARRPRQ